MKIDNVIKKIKEQNELRTTRDVRPFKNFVSKITISEDLFSYIKNKLKMKTLIKEAKSQFIISMITAFEVYFKDLFITIFKLCDENIIVKCGDLIDKNFSLNDLIKISLNKIKLEELISAYLNFQNLDVIGKIFFQLTNIKIYEELKIKKFQAFDGFEYELNKNYYKNIEDLLNLRHKVTHDFDTTFDIDEKLLYDYYSNLIIFITSFDKLIHKDFIELNLKKELK